METAAALMVVVLFVAAAVYLGRSILLAALVSNPGRDFVTGLMLALAGLITMVVLFS